MCTHTQTHSHTYQPWQTMEYRLCSYLWLQGVRLLRCGIRSPCRQSRRPSSHSRRSLGRLKTGARRAAERLPWRPAGTPGRGRVTCLGETRVRMCSRNRSCSAVELSSDAVCKSTTRGSYTLHFSAKGPAFVSASACPERKDRFSHFTEMQLTGSDIMILLHTLKTNKRGIKYIHAFTEALSLM